MIQDDAHVPGIEITSNVRTRGDARRGMEAMPLVTTPERVWCVRIWRYLWPHDQDGREPLSEGLLVGRRTGSILGIDGVVSHKSVNNPGLGQRPHVTEDFRSFIIVHRQTITGREIAPLTQRRQRGPQVIGQRRLEFAELCVLRCQPEA